EEDMRFSDDRAAVDLTYRFLPGALYTVRSIEMRGEWTESAEDKLTRPLLYKDLRIKVGDPYRRLHIEGQLGTAIEGDRKSLERRFKDEGYEGACVTVEAQVVPPGQVDMVYTITQGRKKRIARTIVRGNHATQAPTLLRELSLQPGDWFSQTDMEGDMLRL